MKIKVSTILVSLIFLSACAKEMPAIGGGDPEGEFKSCMKFAADRDFEEAVQCLEMYKARYPQTRLGQEAELKIGDAYYARKDYLLAAESYIAFLLLHPRHPKADYAHFKTGLAYLKESPKAIDRDQSYLQEAIDNLRIVVRHYPESSYFGLAKQNLHIARRRVARRDFYVGKFYYKTGEYIACLPRFQEIAEKYDDSGLADRALYMIVKANLKLDRLDRAKDAFSALASKYPDSKYTKKAEVKLLKTARQPPRDEG